ncbi:MAG: hypothetical protein WBP59_02350 [Ilumatobacteraceae bacterium]
MKQIAAVGALSFLVLASCGGGDDEGADAAPVETRPATTEPVATEPTLDIPASVGDLDEVCESGTGFADLPAYDQGTPGPHPAVVFLQAGDGPFISVRVDVPREWTFGNSDIAVAELVGCGTISERSPNGVTCEAQTVEGETVSLALSDVVYDVELSSAASGDAVGSFQLVAASPECPTGLLNNYEDGQTDYLNVFQLELDDVAVVDALRPFVDSGTAP